MIVGGNAVTSRVRDILSSIKRLSKAEKAALEAELTRLGFLGDYPPLTDDDFIQIAEERFLELDREEEANE